MKRSFHFSIAITKIHNQNQRVDQTLFIRPSYTCWLKPSCTYIIFMPMVLSVYYPKKAISTCLVS